MNIANFFATGSMAGTLVTVVTSLLVITGAFFGYRLYKHAGRRCCNKKKLPDGTLVPCGSLRVKRVCKIHLALDERISLQSVDGRWRWWIRRTSADVFSCCPDCGDIRHVKLIENPFSFLHLWWAWHFHREQFVDDPKLNFVAFCAAKQRYQGLKNLEMSPHRDDAPPFDIDGFLEKSLDDLLPVDQPPDQPKKAPRPKGYPVDPASEG